MEHFFNVYGSNVATPYLHIFAAHIHEFKQIHNEINSFNCQGLEKLNDLTTSQFFRATNKRIMKKTKCDEEDQTTDYKIWIRQILELRNRMDLQSFLQSWSYMYKLKLFFQKLFLDSILKLDFCCNEPANKITKTATGSKGYHYRLHNWITLASTFFSQYTNNLSVGNKLFYQHSNR